MELIQDMLVMLSGEHRGALPEWLQAIAARGWRVPEEHLVDLLEYGRGHTEVRDDILPVLGRRGRWLAGQNPDWKYALQISLFEIENTPETEPRVLEANEAEWQTGTREERVALLQRLRRTHPAQARALVETTWKQDAPDERAAFLATFETGLSMEDEPFLEEALDDRRKEVRWAAQEMLLHLPESRLCQRMWERVRPLVTLQVGVQEAKVEEKAGFLDKMRSMLKPKEEAKSIETIMVELPQECNKAMIRDGIEAKPAYSNIGEKTWWLKQMLERIPLGYWSREWNRSPVDVIAANRSEEWQKLILEAWTASLRRMGDPNWATALFTFWIENQTDKMPMPLDEVWSKNLPPDVFEAGILRLLDTVGQRIQYGNPAFTLLTQVKVVWSAPLTQAVLKKLGAFSGNSYYIASNLGALEPYVPAQFKDAFYAVWNKLAESAPYYQNQIQSHIALNEFRKEMRRKIAAAKEK